MHCGINLGGGDRRGQSRAEGLAARLGKARLAKESGYHSLWTGAGYLNNDFHPLMLLSRVAAEAPGLELGMVALLPLYHPVEAAEQISTLDVITGGKFVLAPALGWRDFQFKAFEIPKSERLSRFREVQEVMEKLWNQDRVTHEGRHFHLDDVPGAGDPIQKPGPKVYLAANLEKGVLRAAKEADGWLVSSRSTLPTIGIQAPQYRAAVKEAGKPGYIAAWREVFVAESRQQAIDIIRPQVEWLYKDRASLGHSQELPEADRIDVPFEQVLEGRFIIGSPEECIEEIHKYKENGVEELILRSQWPGMDGDVTAKSLRLFAEKVMPEFV
jgi:alkanesulfonate monooxygenase SsuD/methylene tetrahydromethanopterin reductase-like flavin-dependent oxidoreductase (luciferase family)